MTKAVNGVAEGQELWFSNPGYRNPNGTMGTDGGNINIASRAGFYWTSTQVNASNGYRLNFNSGSPTGEVLSIPNPKLTAESVRCVR